MSNITIQQQQLQPVSRKEKVWQGIVSLAPLQKFFAWLFRAVAILATFFLAVSSAFIAVQVVLPNMAPDGTTLSNLVQVIMNIAIEAALIGCFEMARDAKKNGDEEQHDKMRRVGIGFFMITIVTLGFKVFNVPPLFDKYLQMGRVIASVIYCITAHPDMKSMIAFDVKPVSLLAEFNRLEESINQRLVASQNGIKSVTESIEKVAQSMPEMAPLPHFDSEKVAQEVAQEVAQLVAQTVAREAIDYSQVAQAILPLLNVSQVPQVPPAMPQPEPPAMPQPEPPAMPQPEPENRQPLPKPAPKNEPKPSLAAPKTPKKSTPEGKLEAAYQKMVTEGKRISGRALADATKINRNAATDWLKVTHPDAISAIKSGTEKVAQAMAEMAEESGTASQEEMPQSSGTASQEEMPQSSGSGAIDAIELWQYRSVPLPQNTGTDEGQVMPVEVETDPELVAVG